MRRLLEDLIPIIWVAEERKGYFRLAYPDEFVGFLTNDLSDLIHGYYDCYTFEDEHFTKG